MTKNKTLGNFLFVDPSILNLKLGKYIKETIIGYRYIQMYFKMFFALSTTSLSHYYTNNALQTLSKCVAI